MGTNIQRNLHLEAQKQHGVISYKAGILMLAVVGTINLIQENE
jgi:hypothetical protein